MDLWGDMKMWSVITACALACCGPSTDANTAEPPKPVIAELKQGLQTGSLIFSQGDCLAVKIFSRSSYTHVAGVVARDGEFFVYDSMNGIGVRKTPLVEYVRQQTPGSIHIVHPKVPFAEEKAAAYVQHLEGQIGRKYAVKHHLTGGRCEGIHCSEYMTEALMAVEMIQAKQPSRVSPGSLLEGVIAADAYQEGSHLVLKVDEPPPLPLKQRWYQRAWHCTATCCSKSATQLRRWVLCR
jgi:hypothetical protein